MLGADARLGKGADCSQSLAIMLRRRWLPLLFALLALLSSSCLGTCSDDASGKTLRLATTTSVNDSGLLAVLLPAFRDETGYAVEVAAVGSGKALKRLAAGEADVAITHAPGAEKQAHAAAEVSRRTSVMRSDFVIVGPADMIDRVAGAGDVQEALRRIAASGQTFVSRGDGSGTHLREQALWKAAGIATDSAFIVAAEAGMGATLERASDDDAFALADRGTFVSQRSDLDLAIVFQNDPALRNVYSVIEPHESASSANADGARAFVAFLRSKKARALIGGFGVEAHGEALFTPEP